MSTASATRTALPIRLRSPTASPTLSASIVTELKRYYVCLRITDYIPETCRFRLVSSGERTPHGRVSAEACMTGMWTYVANPGKGEEPHHVILIGDRFPKRLRPELQGDGPSQVHMGANLIEHEIGHMLHTSRDFAAIHAAAVKEDVSFDCVNVGEDVRIEAIVASQRRRPFNWLDVTDGPPNDHLRNPSNAMIVAKLCAGDPEKVERLLSAADLDARQIACVLNHYHELVHAPGTLCVPALMRRFCDDFRNVRREPPAPENAAGSGEEPGQEEAGKGGSGHSTSPSPGTPPNGEGSADKESPAQDPSNAQAAHADSSAKEASSGPRAEEKSKSPAPTTTPASDASQSDGKTAKSGGDVGGDHGEDGQAGDENLSPSSTAEPDEAGEDEKSPQGASQSASDAQEASSNQPEDSQDDQDENLIPDGGDESGELKNHSVEEEGQSPPSSAEAWEQSPEESIVSPNRDMRIPEVVMGEREAGDLEMAETLELDAAQLDELLHRSMDISEAATRAQNDENTTGGIGMGGCTMVEFSTPGEVLAKGMVAGPLQIQRIDRCVSMLMQAMRGRDEHIQTDRPTKRLNERRSTLDAERPYDQKIEDLGTKGKLKTIFLVDCSASMNISAAGNASPISEGRHFVAVLNELARRQKIEGYLGLSRIIGTTAQVQCLRFPVPNDDIRRIEANGNGEGLQAALVRMAPLIREADMTALYTDGEITDQPIDKGILHRQRVHLHGLYVGPTSAMPGLALHTDSPICAPSLELLVTRYAKSLLAHHARKSHS